MTRSNREQGGYPPDTVCREHVTDGRLLWSASWRAAGTPVEEDGEGVAPLQIRVLLLTQNGEWLVRINDAAARPKVWQVLRSVFPTPLEQLPVLSDATTSIIYVGTRGEATLLVEALAASGIGAELVKR